MLGFYCEVYRREPLCRIYVNNVLVDEFNIPHTTHKDVSTGNMRLDPTFYGHEDFEFKSNTPFLKLIELDDADVKNLDLRVELQNNDNNYSNGFITKHTLVMLCQCWLAPVKVWEEFDLIRSRWKYSRHTWYNSNKSVEHYYSNFRNRIFDNLAFFSDMHFPGIDQMPQTNEQHKSIFSNYKYLPRMWHNHPNRYWLGRSGHLHLTLTKKLGFWRHSTDRRRGWWTISRYKNIKDIYNKYIQHEDQRNSNT